MKPKIFISSTFYDKKDIREDISAFVTSYNYEAVMFEDGDIGYKPLIPLDESCYKAMQESDMVILIIGGYYGSPATGENENSDDFLSVTRKEFRTAVENGIPIYSFIEQNVLAEFEVFKNNYLNPDFNIGYKATKNVNVFRFLKEIEDLSIIPMIKYNKSSDIKDFLGKQWAHMFKEYLSGVRKENRSDSTFESKLKYICKEISRSIKIIPRDYNKRVYVEAVLDGLILTFKKMNEQNTHIYNEIEKTKIINYFITNTEKRVDAVILIEFSTVFSNLYVLNDFIDDNDEAIMCMLEKDKYYENMQRI